MSGSSGLNLTPETLLKLYEPEVILWLYSKTEPLHAFDFCFDDEILRQYFEYDKMLSNVREGKADDRAKEIIANATIAGREPELVPMAQLVSFGSIVDFNPAMLETVFEKIGTPYKEAQFGPRLALAKYWAEQCSPESLNKLLAYRNFEKFETLTAEEKKEIELLYTYLSGSEYTLEDLNTELYAIPGKVYTFADDKERKAAQGKFFKNVYELLIGKEKGPRLYLFLFAIEKEKYLSLLDFSTPQTEDEKKAAEAAKVVEVEEEPAIEVDPIKEQIVLDDFDKIDMRVCKILKAEEVKKSHSCLKLTLFDGLGERVIMSSIKNEYTPEQLEGKKIIVIANLKPAKLAGVVSNGMLIAASHEQCGCKIIFVDDSVPEGTAIH